MSSSLDSKSFEFERFVIKWCVGKYTIAACFWLVLKFLLESRPIYNASLTNQS